MPIGSIIAVNTSGMLRLAPGKEEEADITSVATLNRLSLRPPPPLPEEGLRCVGHCYPISQEQKLRLRDIDVDLRPKHTVDAQCLLIVVGTAPRERANISSTEY